MNEIIFRPRPKVNERYVFNQSKTSTAAQHQHRCTAPAPLHSTSTVAQHQYCCTDNMEWMTLLINTTLTITGTEIWLESQSITINEPVNMKHKGFKNIKHLADFIFHLSISFHHSSLPIHYSTRVPTSSSIRGQGIQFVEENNARNCVSSSLKHCNNTRWNREIMRDYDLRQKR